MIHTNIYTYRFIFYYTKLVDSIFVNTNTKIE
jgi:hypothetical protein